MRSLGKLGTGGRQQKTIDGHGTGVTHFNDFINLCRDKNIGAGANKVFKYFEKWTADDFSNELVFQEYAFYLAHDAVKVVVATKNKGEAIKETEDGEPLAISTARQYFSNFLQAVIKKHGEKADGTAKEGFFKQFQNLKKGESIPWVKRIRDDMRNEMERDLMLAGIPAFVLSRGIGREGMIVIVDTLVQGCK